MRPGIPKSINNYNLGGDSMQSNKVTRLSKIIGNHVNVDLNALVYAVRNLYSFETAIPELIPKEIEKICLFLDWCPFEVTKQTMQRRTPLAKLENRVPLRWYLKAYFPQLNHKSLQEVLSTDTVLLW